MYQFPFISLVIITITELNNKLILKQVSGSVFSPYQNRCRITTQVVHASDVYFDFKIDLTMQYTINVVSETPVAVISNSKYYPKSIKQFPLIEYVYGSLSTLIIYPNGDVNVYIPKGGIIQNGFANNQQLSFRGSYAI